MKLFFLFIFTIFLLLFQLSCDLSSGQTTRQKTNLIIETSSNKVISDNSQKNDRDDDSVMFYGAIIETICYQSDFHKFSGTTVGFKRETIKSENVEILKSITEINPATIDNFIQRNAITKKLIDGYGVKYDLQAIDKEDSYENLLEFAHKKNLRIKSIIGLSRIGFSQDKTQSLAYFEFYGSDRNLKKNYILITWDYSQGGSMVKDVKWFSAE